MATPAIELLHAADAEERQRCVAGGLLSSGCVAGDRVAFVTTSGGDMLCAILGALRVGVVPVLTHAALLTAERQPLLDAADVRLVVDDAALAGLVGHTPADIAPWPLARPMHFTSGTTGTPKGVWSGLLDEDDAAALVAEEADLWGFDAGDRHLVCSPFHHSVSIRFAAGTLLAGGSLVLPGPFEAGAVADAIVAAEPTTTFMVPTHLQRLFVHLGDDRPGALRRFRLVAHAGAPCPGTLKHAAFDAFGSEVVWEFYGSTEGQFTACGPDDWREHPGTVGRARPGRVVTADPDGVLWCEAPPWARFAYWRDPERTAAAWRPAAPDSDAFGAFSVGDLGRVDDEGWVYLDGRRDDLVITGGVNVYPAEVEATIARLDGVSDVAVFGVDDDAWGQRLCAAVVGEVTEEQLRTHVSTNLAGHKRPKTYHLVDELPYTATGKLQRGVVAARFAG